jgi:hypothetical protein
VIVAESERKISQMMRSLGKYVRKREIWVWKEQKEVERVQENIREGC